MKVCFPVIGYSTKTDPELLLKIKTNFPAVIFSVLVPLLFLINLEQHLHGPTAIMLD